MAFVQCRVPDEIYRTGGLWFSGAVIGAGRERREVDRTGVVSHPDSAVRAPNPALEATL